MNGIAAFPLKTSYLKTKKLQGAHTVGRLASNPQWDQLREHLQETMFCSSQTRFPVDFPSISRNPTIFAHLPGSLRPLSAVRVR